MSVENLEGEERQVVRALRAVPPSPLRERLLTLVGELLDFAAHPSCAEMQADGVPCSSSEAACDECRKATSLIDGLRSRLGEG